MISVILPTFLGPYAKAATDREPKLRRAIQSVIDQTFQDWQLVVVCDGCERSLEIVKEFSDSRIKALLIDKQPMFSGMVRNMGLDHASGELICYLDNDDYFGADHLELISQPKGFNWLFFNDYTLTKDGFAERYCYLKSGKCGTSNIAHKREMKARWDVKNRYGADDWTFIQKLQYESVNFTTCQGRYLVCHIPNKYDI